jgi:hypothetical protein
MPVGSPIVMPMMGRVINLPFSLIPIIQGSLFFAKGT